MLDTVSQARSSSSWVSESNAIRIGSRWADHVPVRRERARLLLGFYPYNGVVLLQAGAEAYVPELDQKSPLTETPQPVIATEGTSRETLA